MNTRIERDSIGEIEVPADHYWGAQTQRSIVHFAIGDDRMPIAVCHALALVKRAAATVNARRGGLPQWKADLIVQVADEIVDGRLDGEFPLFLFQTGSGTHTNMNVNEVISNRAIELHGGVMGSKDPIHPNDDVNMSQSSNDTFPTAMHVAAVRAASGQLLPALRELHGAIAAKSEAWRDVVKIGRTHLQDATPITVGQEWSGYAAQVADAVAEVEHAIVGLHRLAIGGTAVGTGINAPQGFGDEVAAELARLTGHPFVGAPNRFAAQSAMDDVVRLSAALRGVAVALFKFANDVRWSASGPRAGLDELHLPANEPGSSIMPGKVNPSQAEAMLQVCIQVMANDTAVALAGAEGNFQLNVFRPVAIGNVLRSISLLAGTCTHTREFLVDGAEVNRGRLQSNVERSVMLVTALSPTIGYDRAAEIAHLAVEHDLTLRDAALRSGVTAEQFDSIVVPADLT
ncbi:MAG: class II fumarate hydratase [Ilumatobacteraceae bacterium]